MKIINGDRNNICEIKEEFRKRNDTDFKKYNSTVEKILQDVKDDGDKAIIKYTNKFDGVDLVKAGIKVTPEEIEAGWKKADKKFIKVLRKAIENIRSFHEKQKENSWFTTVAGGGILGQRVTSLEKVGLYVPGGTAAYPSSVLMNAIPAMVAGVEEIIMVTPPLANGGVNEGVLAAAKELGINEIYRVGGAQAIGALAFGTESIPKVDKIVGPGNIYVATAKRQVYGFVDIDMIAGPSEILVIADESANPTYVAADLLSQAEHDTLASAICITTSEEMALAVKDEIVKQTELLERKEIIRESLKNYGSIIVVSTLEAAIEISNEIAPEHLELCIEDPFIWLDKIKNAGAIFIGNFSPEPLGDYMAGPNHVLPTSGTARFFSPLSVDDFVKKSSIIYYSKEALEKSKDDIMIFAELEALTAHKNAIKVRFEK
ncbi:histidinol dehydrogenase [Alkaliphilus peptidifermentans]|uniref:Histidinol dehydrogenase n=1 Tax=Alkaliphilus peptidifermentans DSM 18978 TaxID=1120976 RepID=A0A1G5AD94_9FIRM|nr:histidinol dehydrogenase [Alkaliphilus peptidifermentans]SCX75841.1 histidinol dehydrogenase [Alkaliphilus peptidifermentans DSM 18978]